MPPKILVVDDDADLRATFAAFFEQEGYLVYEAEDGAAALDVAAALVPDLVLLDLNLPRVTGSEVLRKLRKEPETADLPVVVVSAQLPEYLPRLEGLRFQAALEKPCAPTELIAAVQSALRVK